MRTRLAALYEDLDERDSWDSFAISRNLRDIDNLRRELAEIGEGLDIALDGVGVHGSMIEYRRFQQLIEPVVRAIRWSGRDLIARGVQPVSNTSAPDLVEPIFASTFPGSFGVRLAPPKTTEQQAFDGTVFERAVGRVIGVLKLAVPGAEPEAIFGAVVGFRANALKAVRDSALALSESAATTRFRWQGGAVVVIEPQGARELAEVLASATPEEETIEVQGVLEGGDLDNGSFHLIAAIEVGGRPRHLRGTAEEGPARQLLRGIPLGSVVRAVLQVVRLDSPVRATPQETWLLSEVEILEAPPVDDEPPIAT